MSCNCGNPGCQSSTQCGCGPSPYYTNVSTCPEDNRLIINNVTFAANLKSGSSFNMPACGQNAYIKFPGLIDIALNSKIWAFGVGFLTVVAFDPDSQTVTALNDCETTCGTQATPGTLVAICTNFVPTVPPCPNSGGGGSSSIYPYLAAQFTAQANSVCIPITVTNTNGLSAGKLIQVSGGTYLLQTITDGTHITICNQGQGVTPGTVVNAVDSGGNYITPIILVDSNPCTNTVVTAGKPLVCHNNSQAPLEGVSTGQVLVYDASSHESSFQNLLIPVGECTVLTECLSIDPTLDPTYQYLLYVLDSSIFAPTDIFTVGGTPFTVVSIPDATHIRATINDVPGSAFVFPVGTPVCEADCCAVNTAAIEELDTRVDLISSQLTTLHISQAALSTAKNGTINAGAPDLYSNTATVTANNSLSPSLTAHIMYTATARLQGVGHAVNNDYLTMTVDLQLDFNGAGFVSVVPQDHAMYSTVDVGQGANNLRFDTQKTWSGVITVPAATSYTLAGRLYLHWIGADASSYVVDNMDVAVTIFGIKLA